jgi:hypothetical protein
MYQFTKETIINSNLDSNGTSVKFSGANGQLTVLRAGNFKATEVVSCFKNPYVAPVLEKLVDTVTTNAVATKVYRLYIKLKRVDSYIADYSNDMSYNALEKYYEATGVTGAANLVAAFETAINRENRIKENPYFKVSKNSAEITLEVLDEYTRFEKVEVQEINTTSLTGYDSFTVLEDLIAGATTLTTGKVGFGTVKQITKNLRLPSQANTNWLALNQEEKPEAGGNYTQYAIRLKTDRGDLGGVSALGQEIKSVTTHIFYVKSSLVSAFDAAIVAAGISIDTVGTAVTAITITSGTLDISDVVGGEAYQITYTTTPSGVTGAIFTLNTAASTVDGTADWTKVSVSNNGLITLAADHGLIAGDKIAVNVLIDGYAVTVAITLVA